MLVLSRVLDQRVVLANPQATEPFEVPPGQAVGPYAPRLPDRCGRTGSRPLHRASACGDRAPQQVVLCALLAEHARALQGALTTSAPPSSALADEGRS